MKGCGLLSLPEELLFNIDLFLSVEDSHNFKMTNQRIGEVLNNNFQHFDKMHLSDDQSECRVTDSRGRVAPRSFRAENASQLLHVLPNLKDITVIMKDVPVRRDPRIPPANITECTPYARGGYLLQLLGEIPPSQLALRQLSLHVDVMIESLTNIILPCPVEDLHYAMSKLQNASFNTFVQISICCALFDVNDETARNIIIAGMQHVLKAAADNGAKTEFVVEPCEGYVDMTIEKGQVEYSFAFFYYNPTICEPSPEDSIPIEQQKEIFSPFEMN